MKPITQFLLDRIAEDEQAARAVLGVEGEWCAMRADDLRKWWVNDALGGIADTGGNSDSHRIAEHVARHDPARVLAECEGKRRIIATYQSTRDPAVLESYRDDVLPWLALPYAGHPEYSNEWSAA